MNLRVCFQCAPCCRYTRLFLVKAILHVEMRLHDRLQQQQALQASAAVQPIQGAASPAAGLGRTQRGAGGSSAASLAATVPGTHGALGSAGMGSPGASPAGSQVPRSPGSGAREGSTQGAPVVAPGSLAGSPFSQFAECECAWMCPA